MPIRVRSLFLIIGCFLFPQLAHGALITFDFEGIIQESSDLFNSGDLFSGSYTLESAASVIPHPELDLQSVSISEFLPGTGWNMDVFSSVVPSLSLAGTGGVVAISNDRPIFGDRYVVTLSRNSAGGIPLPISTWPLDFFQIDLVDSELTGANMLADGNFFSLPDISTADSRRSGRFMLRHSSSGCTQCHIETTSLTQRATTTESNVIPEPTSLSLLGLGLMSILGFRRHLKP